MVRRVIVPVVVIFVVLYVIQITIYSVRETHDTIAITVGRNDQIDVSILLGEKPSDKYIPGLGLVRIITGEPCRIEARYKDQRVYRRIEKLEDVKLDMTEKYVDAEKYYVQINVFEKPFGFKK
ncbi:MAG: hypothetical protein E3J72_16440 [Planctomycetota bacterium]|nr:MAG: hypothetical protein E3J72_16440 [Planctomycetota bacterium]